MSAGPFLILGPMSICSMLNVAPTVAGLLVGDARATLQHVASTESQADSEEMGAIVMTGMSWGSCKDRGPLLNNIRAGLQVQVGRNSAVVAGMTRLQFGCGDLRP